MNESLLIEQLRNSSETAFNAIYKMYVRTLLAFCHQYTKSMEEAEDIVQEVFTGLWKSRVTIQRETTLRPLLLTMSRNRLINAYRRTVNSPVFEEFTEYRGSTSADDASRQMEYDEFVRKMRRVIGSMPATQQRVIDLTRFQGKSIRETAEMLGLSEQTVKNQVSLGLKTLRSELLRMIVTLWLLHYVN